MRSKVKLLLFWKSIKLSLILHKIVSTSIIVFIVRKIKLEIFIRKFGAVIKK